MLDQRKAFDYVSRDCLWVVMTARGLPDPIIHMTKWLYVGSTVQVKANEVLTDGFEGCPLSAALGLMLHVDHRPFCFTGLLVMIAFLFVPFVFTGVALAY